MAKSSTFDADVLKLIFQALSIANLADNTATSPNASLYVSLHTADPTSAGNQSSNEANYTSYARVAVNRDVTGFTIAGQTISNAAVINFPSCTGGASVVTHIGIGTASAGAGKLLYYGALTASLSISNGVTPTLQVGQLQISET